jgi:hypothetical protein
VHGLHSLRIGRSGGCCRCRAGVGVGVSIGPEMTAAPKGTEMAFEIAQHEPRLPELSAESSAETERAE